MASREPEEEEKRTGYAFSSLSQLQGAAFLSLYPPGSPVCCLRSTHAEGGLFRVVLVCSVAQADCGRRRRCRFSTLVRSEGDKDLEGSWAMFGSRRQQSLGCFCLITVDRLTLSLRTCSPFTPVGSPSRSLVVRGSVGAAQGFPLHSSCALSEPNTCAPRCLRACSCSKTGESEGSPRCRRKGSSCRSGLGEASST